MPGGLKETKTRTHFTHRVDMLLGVAGEIQGHPARSPPLAKSVAKIRFEPRPIKMGSGWLVIVRFPDRPEIEVPSFATEADAQNWVTNDSWAWLKKLGYGD
jgi:hypothetical protein